MSYCDWGNCSPEMQKYHDSEWGVPVLDDYKMFEFLFLECMQCGLSWNLMIQKREIFRKCFDNFDFEKIAQYTQNDIERILQYPEMIRSPRKVAAIINNAQCFINIRQEYGSFTKYLWNFTNGKTVLYRGHEHGKIPACNGLSVRISRDLKHRGFKYLGPTVIYSHLQACGIINDHDKNCIQYSKINKITKTITLPPDDEK